MDTFVLKRCGYYCVEKYVAFMASQLTQSTRRMFFRPVSKEPSEMKRKYGEINYGNPPDAKWRLSTFVEGLLIYVRLTHTLYAYWYSRRAFQDLGGRSGRDREAFTYDVQS